MNVLLSVFHDSLKTNLSQHKPFDHENKNNVPEEVDEKGITESHNPSIE